MPIIINELLDFNSNFSKEIKTFRKSVINNSVDKSLKPLIVQLKSELRTYIQDNLKIEDNIDEKGLAQPKIKESSSRTEILKQLTGIKDFQPNKSFSELGDGVIFAGKSRNQDIAARMELSISHDLVDNIEMMHAKAREFYSKAIFALPNNQGGFNYYQNNGYDPGEDLKVKCSKYTGTDDEEPFGGMSPQRRFEADASKGYSTWSLKQRFVEQIPNNPSFIHLNPIIDKIAEGEFDTSQLHINNIKNKEIQQKYQTETDNFKNNENLTPNAQDIINVHNLINKIQVQKIIQKKSVVYKIVSVDNDVKKKFIDELKSTISQWKIHNEIKMVAAIEKRIQDFINRISR